MDARARRKRRQLSSASYYISNINPYSTSYNPAVPLTYPSGSYYTAPGYGYPNTGYSSDRPYDPTLYNAALNQYGLGVPYGSSQLQNLGSTYGSGFYGPYVPGLTGYGMAGFNNQYPNWNQGNSNQYFTGGTGTGLVNTGYTWYRSLRNSPFQGQQGDNSIRPHLPPGSNAPIGMNPPFQPNLPPRSNVPIGMNPQFQPNRPIGINSGGPMKKSAPMSSSAN